MTNDDFFGDHFQDLSKYARDRITGGARPEKRAEPFKQYPEAKNVSIALDDLPDGPLWRALQNRRSRRTFTNEPISKQTLARLLWAAQGPTAKAGEFLLRTAPSAGALYPIETYLLINHVNDIEPGVYHYNLLAAALEQLRPGSYGRELSEAALGQGMCARAAAVFIFTAVVGRCKWKYAQRAYRYIYLDAGHIGENLYLAAEDLGLGCCSMGAFFDDEVNALLGVDGESETAVYLVAAGPAKPGREEIE